MKCFPFPAPRLRYWLPVAAACAMAAAGWQARKPTTPVLGNFPEVRESARSTREPKLSAEEAVGAWRPAARPAESEASIQQGITITGQASPARAEAFRKLLAQLRPGNAAEFHHLLVSADEEGAGLSDEEWRTLLEKWGRLDGPVAAAYLGSQPDGVRLLPGLLRGWAAINREAAAAWLEGRAFPAGQEPWKTAAQRELVLGWSAADLQGAAAWLNHHHGEPGYGTIAAAFAEEVTSIDPENALEWAMSTDGAARSHAIQSVTRAWMKQDSKSALEKLQAAGFSLDEIRTWEAAPNEGYDLLDPKHTDLPEIHFAEDP